ncbi:SIS domain-containing protein [Thiospirochaeta perfilievii]|uniref:SIS domain-containing protein n=2 Tax=Thiospirochaeta perfilievii TaxID=252967 RepID=A0A5C1QIU6_9SPIO|nr:SIS domain-containing protein [Thiospirochaeta perfilievii]
MVESTKIIESINTSVKIILDSYKNCDGSIFFAGNGGSAADAQHLAAELVGRFYLNRKSLKAEAITVNTSTITAVANDYGYDNIFSRAIEGKGRKGDVFVGISTSGNSKNIVNAVKLCKEIGIKTIGFTGENLGIMDDICDVMVKIPSSNTPRIQEGHILAGHIICELVEKEMFPNV